MSNTELGPISLERMVRAVEKVRQRLLRATAALEQAGVPYAVADDNAIAAWVARVDEAAVRNTQDVDILIRRADLPAVTSALESAGFVRRHAAGIEMFLDGPDAKARDAVHVVFAEERVREEYVEPAPGVDQIDRTDQFRVLSLEALVTMKLTSFRRKDQVHLLDLRDVGLIDEQWCDRYSEPLAERLRELLSDPNE